MPEEFKNKQERESYIAKFVTEKWRSVERETYSDRQRYSEAFNLFNGKQTWSDREDWQATPFLHEYSKTIRRAADLFTNIVLQKDDFFALQPVNKEDPGISELARIFEKLVKYRLNQIHLASLFYDFCIAGGCTGLGICKLWVEPQVSWEPEVVLEEIDADEAKAQKKLSKDIKAPTIIPQDPQQLDALFSEAFETMFPGTPNGFSGKRSVMPKKHLELVFKAGLIDPRNFAFEPDVSRIQDSQFQIEKFTKRFYEFEHYFESGLFDKSKYDEVLGHNSPYNVGGSAQVASYDEMKIATRDQYPGNDSFAPVHEFLEYHGPLIGKKGNILEEKRHFIVVNGKTVLLDRRMPSWTQEAPYYYAVFSKSPFKAVGKGISDNGRDHQILMNDLFGTFIDMLKLSVYPPMVADLNAIQNSEEIEEGLFPRMLIKSFGKTAKEVFSEVQFSANNIAPVLFQTLERLKLSIETSAGVDVSSSNPASRARISATEIESNSSRTDESVLALARQLDNDFIIPIIQGVVNLELQYGFEVDVLQEAQTRGVITETEFQLIANIPRVERYREIKQHYQIKIKGFRERMERQSLLRNMVDFFTNMANVPPEVVSKIDWTNALEDFVEAFGFDTNRWIIQNNPQDKAREENAILKQNQFISIGEADDDQAHLFPHFDLLLKSPTESALAHVQGHIQRVLMRGEKLPQMPPEIMEMLGIGQEAPAQANGTTNGAMH